MVHLTGSFHSYKVDDFTEEEYGSLSKRPRFAAIHHNQVGSEKHEFPSRSLHGNALEEPSPLGLRLKKSPSLLDLIQMRLSQSCSSSAPTKNMKGIANSSANDKLKASNFPASLLRIGTWEYVSRYEGDLVAKCYFAKHKLVWEVLEGGLKSKLEIQWSDVMALKADCPDDGPGSLTIVLARQPAFFREINPQPRKHTLWQATSDFTDGQASINRQHFIQCSPGVLNKHYEKLIECDPRLGILSQQPEKITGGSPFFENPDEPKGDDRNQLPVIDTHATDRDFGRENGRENMEDRGGRLSMSMNDLMNLFGDCISEQMNAGGLPSDKASECRDILENISQVLLSDNTQNTTTMTSVLDESSLMKKVNSLCCLLQQDQPVMASSTRPDGGNRSEGADRGKSVHFEVANGSEGNLNFGQGSSKHASSSLQRKDSLGDFLLHLPRIASLPKFLFGIQEEDD